MATYATESTAETEGVYAYLVSKGFEPNDVRLDERGWAALIDEIDKLNLWDVRRSDDGRGAVLSGDSWGFRRISSPAVLDSVLGEPLMKLTVTENRVAANDSGARSAEHSTPST